MSVSNDPKPHFPSDLSGDPTDPEDDYTFGAAIDMQNHLFCDVLITTSGDVPTSFEVKRQWSDDGTTFTDEDVEQVSGGTSVLAPRVITLNAAANGTYTLPFQRAAKRYCRLAIKRTGGGAGTLAVATYTLAMG